VPGGATNWFAPDFDPLKAGWKKGLGSFSNVPENTGCTLPFCGCADKPATAWDKEVLLLRRTFDLPPLKPGHRYRLVVGGRSHVYTSDGWAVYVNGRLIAEAKSKGGMGSGGLPKGAFITTDWLNDFKGGKVVVAAIAFQGNRKRDNINIWFEEMKIPPFSAKQLHQWAADISLLSSDWQARQNPSRNPDDPEAGKFKWDGKVAASPTLSGTWTALAQVATEADFVPAKQATPPGNLRIKTLDLKNDGTTGDPLWLWSGNTLMDLELRQALNITPKKIDGTDYLFIEAGGFSDKNPKGWKPPLIVMKRSAVAGK
jgi:hypothetical protein